jgi:hypothetical protein
MGLLPKRFANSVGPFGENRELVETSAAFRTIPNLAGDAISFGEDVGDDNNNVNQKCGVGLHDGIIASM